MLKHFFILTIAAIALGSPTNKISFKSRIVGGKDASINDYPWQVSVELYRFHTCGGSIISENYVVTAAQCTNGYFPTDFQVLANTSTVTVSGIRINVSKIYIHPLYNMEINYDYDISVLELATPLKLGTGVQAINLPDKGSAELNTGSSVNVTGWGYLKENSIKYSYQLQVVEVYIVDRKECVQDYYMDSVVTKRMICSGVPKGGKDSCGGDLGGPLVANNTLYGIISWGLGCAREGFPGVYSNVLVLREFITYSTGL